MSARRVLAGSAVALLLPASLLLTVETGSATDSAARPASTSVTKKASQKISLEVLPQIVQQGKGTASADSAKAAVAATIKPVKVGRKVVLEQLNGSSWKKVGTAKQEKSGRANFSAVVSKGGAAVTYRVTAQKFKGLKKVSSTSADTAQWLTPTFTDEFSGSTLSPVWGMRGQKYEPQSKRKCSKGDPKAVKVGSGALRLSVIKDKSAKGKCKATSRKQNEEDLLPPQRPRRHRGRVRLPLRRRRRSHQDAEVAGPARQLLVAARRRQRPGQRRPRDRHHRVLR